MEYYSKKFNDEFGAKLAELGEQFKEIAVVDADLHNSTGVTAFKNKFPARFINVGIAESNMFGVAGGLAHAGFIPFPATISSFSSRKCLDQIYMNICWPKANVKIPGSHGGLTGGLTGPSHNVAEDLAIMRTLPNMYVCCFGDNRELRSAMDAMIAYNGPVYFRVPRVNMPVLFDEDYKFEWGKGNVLKEGTDVTIVSTGIMTGGAVKAAEILAKEGISAEVIHMGCIKPLDEELVLTSAKKTGAVLTVENGRKYGGLGSAVAETLAAKYPTKVVSMGIGDEVITSGQVSDLLRHYKLTPQDIATEAKSAIGK